jgi:hypothetical protein
MFFDIIKAQYVDDYRIKLHFEDGSTGIANLSDYPDKTNVFQKFFDLEYFKNFQINYGTLTWGDGDVDIAPETLYTITTGKPILFDTIKRSEIK